MKNNDPKDFLNKYLGVFRYTRHAMSLVWGTSRSLTVAFAVLTLLGGVLPPAMAWIGKEIIDSVLLATQNQEAGGVLFWIGLFI